MPGLVGLVSLNRDKIDSGLIQAMRDAIRHRDWYKVDDYVDPLGTVAISHVHLGVINKDKQPYSACNGQVQVFLHGEIYDDQAVRSDPLQFISHLYEQKGAEFASFLNGSFVIIIVDRRQNRVLIANDRTATKPLFYFNDGHTLYFGPEMKSLLPAASLERKLDLAAVADFLANGYLTCEHTLIKGLVRMDSATVLEINAGGVARKCYWQLEFEREEPDRGLKYYQQTLAGLVRQAVKRRLRTDGTYGVLLSGGYDSRGILGCCLEVKNARELHTISWGREEDLPHSDCIIARQLAHKLGTQHRFYKLTAQDVLDNFDDFVLLGEGLTDYAESFDVFHQIREHQGVDLVLRGDEDWGSSRLYLHDEHALFRTMGVNALRYIDSLRRVLKPDTYRLFCELDAETRRRVSATCKARNIHNRRDFFSLNILTRYYLNPLNYVKTFALESLTPWLDYDILDFIGALPIPYRLDRTLYKKTIVEMFPAVFEQTAHVRNDINWTASLRSSPPLKQFVYRKLIQEQNEMTEFLDRDKLKSELDAFFAAASPKSPGFAARAKANAIRLLEQAPAALDLVHGAAYSLQKRQGKLRDPLRPEKFVMRLLILKVWGDIFLNYPTAKTSQARS